MHFLLQLSELCPDDKHLTRIFSSEVSIAFLWLLVANLAISPPHLGLLWQGKYLGLVFAEHQTCSEHLPRPNWILWILLWSLVACVEGRMYLFWARWDRENWSLVWNKRWLLLEGSKCTIFVIVAVGGVWFDLSREVGCFSEWSFYCTANL